MDTLLMQIQELYSLEKISKWPVRTRGIGSTRAVVFLRETSHLKNPMMIQLKACITVNMVLILIKKNTTSTCREEVSDSSRLLAMLQQCQPSLLQPLSSFFKCATTVLNWRHMEWWWPLLWTCCWHCWWCWSPTSAPRREAQHQLHTLPKVVEIH